MEKTEQSKYWLDLLVADILEQYPKGEVLVSSGISPSASYHIGHFREVLTADAIVRKIQESGRKARHLHFSDNFDPLRRRYEFLPKEFDQFVGQPICMIPDPDGCHENYAKHYYAEFEAAAKAMGVEMDVVFSYEEQYKTGKMAPSIEKVLEHIEPIKEIFERVSGRKLEDDWTPVQVINPDTQQFFNARLSTWQKEDKTIEGVDYSKGNVKLNWRLDWPARWALWGVQVEPFGKELATKGSSYDTGKEFVKLVFDAEPPYPVPYDTINLKGDTKKMSSSLGNLVTPDEALEIMPAEVLRYFVLRSRPEKIIVFDPGLGLFNVIEEYKLAEVGGDAHEFSEAYKLAVAGANQRTITSIPFTHMVATYQAALGDLKLGQEILSRGGYEKAVKEEAAVLKREWQFVKNWLAKYAPEEVKFEVQKSLPKAELSDAQKQFLADLADGLDKEPNLNGQGIHDLVYACREKADLKPQQAFQAIYRVLLGKDSGPRAGWFLESLERPFLLARLRLEK